MEQSATIQCPYCGYEQDTLVKGEVGQQVEICDVDNGGCDKWYVIKWESNVTTKSHKVDSMND